MKVQIGTTQRTVNVEVMPLRTFQKVRCGVESSEEFVPLYLTHSQAIRLAELLLVAADEVWDAES